MRAVIQRVSYGAVKYNEVKQEINKGYVILLGIEKNDSEKDIDYLVGKILNLRIFPNEEDKFDKTIFDVKGDLLIISQFTLLADCSKGRRPDFTRAANFNEASILYEKFIEKIKKSNLNIKTGKFGEKMLVEIHNDGPVTVIIDSKK